MWMRSRVLLHYNCFSVFYFFFFNLAPVRETESLPKSTSLLFASRIIMQTTMITLHIFIDLNYCLLDNVWRWHSFFGSSLSMVCFSHCCRRRLTLSTRSHQLMLLFFLRALGHLHWKSYSFFLLFVLLIFWLHLWEAKKR